jgi:pyruvate/2-oxoglutarate dehydrogenase complex dihydrolipoamide acyltransferase (E2) component
MATINLGTLEAVLTLKDKLSPAMATASKSIGSIQAPLRVASTSLQALDTKFAASTQKISGFADGVGRTATTLARSASAFGLPIGPLRALDDVMDVVEIGFGNLTKAAAGFNAASIGVAGAGLAIGVSIGTALRNLTPLGAWLDKYADKLSGLTAVEADARAASRAAFEKLKAGQAESISPANLEATVTARLKQKTATEAVAKASELLGFKVKDLAAAERVLAIQEDNSAAGLAKATAAREKAARVAKEAAEAAAKHATALRVLDFQLLGMRNRIDEATLSLEQHLSTWVDFKEMDLSGDIEALNKFLGQGPELDPNVIGSQIAAGKKAMESMGVGPALKASFQAAVKDLPGVILAAFQGGGDVGKAIGAHLGGSIGTSLGESLGPKLKDVFGKTLGGALGSLAGPLGSVLGGLAGGLLGKVGGFFKGLFGGSGEEKKVKQLRADFIAAAGGIEVLRERAKEAGISIDKMLNAKKVKDFESAVASLNDAFDLQGEAEDALKEAVDRYGFSIEELGPKFRQQELDKMAAGLLQDYKLLTASGIDNTLVISKMGPAMNEYVQTALAAGIAVPIAMKPQIDAMIAAGQLLDANGNAYASAEAAGITYAQTMTDMFTQLMDRVGQLVNALLGIPNVTTTVTTVHEDIFREGARPPMDDFAAAGGFHGMVSRPTRLLVGEGGPERVDVTPRGERAPGAGTSIELNPSFHIDPLQSNAGRADLGKFLMQQFFREARNSPMLRQVLREGGR